MNQVNNYSIRLRAGESLKPIEAVNIPDRGVYILDGHHRYVASMKTGISIDINISSTGGPVGLPNWSSVVPIN